jgi:hypothetical protein
MLHDHLLLLPLRSRELEVDHMSLHTLAKHKDMVMFDVKDPRRFFQPQEVTGRTHIGMARYVDEPFEIRHSLSWESFDRTTSGRLAKTKSSFGCCDIVLASDSVWYSDNTAQPKIGRVTYICVI